jgi:hypothetical protein
LPEVRVSLGGEPERDDTGLPPVDIEIPDDARELDGDMQAYHRELRALRRELRHRRLAGPLARDGIVLPLLAGCLVLALIAGTLLTVFTAAGLNNETEPGATGRPASTPSSHAASASSTPSGTVPQLQRPSGRLPHATVAIDGKSTGLYQLIGAGAVLVLVPQADCNCNLALAQLYGQAGEVGLPVVLVSSGVGLRQAGSLASITSSAIKVADDKDMVLAHRYGEAGLTALLVRRDGQVLEARHVRAGVQLTGPLQDVAAAAPAG